MRVLKVLLILAVAATGILANGGHDHVNESAQLTKSSPPTDHPSVLGRLFEIVISRCDAHNVNLYISDSQTNQPIADAQVDTIASGDISLTVKSQAAKKPGVYLLPLRANDGSKVTLELKVSTSKMRESLRLTISSWPKASGKCAS